MRVDPKVATLLLCALAAVSNASNETNAVPEPNQAGGVVVASNPVAVTVNGSVITEAEIDARIKPQLEKFSAQMGPEGAERYAKYMRARVLEGMIVERLIEEQIKKENISVSDSDVNDRINEIITQQNTTPEGFNSMLQARGQSMEQVRQQIQQGMAFEKLMESKSGKTDVNEAQALVYYNEHKQEYSSPDQVKASHILIKVEAGAPEEEKAQARKKAEELLKQIKEGADFAALAKENSDCPSKAQGGDLGFFEKGQMVKPFSDAAFAMKVGDVSDIVETQFGYHIIKVTDRKEAGQTPFEEAKQQIITTLQQEKRSRIYRDYVDKLKAEANIVYPAGKEPTPPMPMPMGRRAAPAKRAEAAPAENQQEADAAPK